MREKRFNLRNHRAPFEKACAERFVDRNQAAAEALRDYLDAQDPKALRLRILQDAIGELMTAVFLAVKEGAAEEIGANPGLIKEVVAGGVSKPGANEEEAAADLAQLALYGEPEAWESAIDRVHSLIRKPAL